MDRDEGDPHTTGRAARLLRQLSGPSSGPALSPAVPDLDALAAAGRADLLAGEAELEQAAACVVRQGEVDALLGCPAPAMPALTERLSAIGASVVPLPALPTNRARRPDAGVHVDVRLAAHVVAWMFLRNGPTA
jgi:hypothetical protein